MLNKIIFIIINISILVIAQKRIINGDTTIPYSYSFIVSIEDKQGGHYCAGTLLDRETILTASHCKPKDIEDVIIRVHRHDLKKKDSEENGFTSEVRKITNHKEFDDSTLKNDISIWKLSNKIPDNIKVIFVKLAQNDIKDDVKLKNLTTIGWGYINFEEKKSATQLQVAKLKYFNHKQCIKKWKSFTVNIDNNTICTKYQNKKQSICNGDSGGPLVYYDIKDNSYIQVGIISFGEERCDIENDYPDGFLRVQSYLGWIKSNSINISKKSIKCDNDNCEQINRKSLLSSITTIFYRGFSNKNF